MKKLFSYDPFVAKQAFGDKLKKLRADEVGLLITVDDSYQVAGHSSRKAGMRLLGKVSQGNRLCRYCHDKILLYC